MTNLFEIANSAYVMGNSVRAPSLQPGCFYLMKDWKSTHNKFEVVEFVGCGTENSEFKQVLAASNYKLNEMKSGQYYFFRAVNKTTGEVYSFGAYQSNACLVVGSSASRVTFSSIVGCTYEGGVTPTPAPTKTVSSAPAKLSKRTKLVVATVDEEDETSPVDDDDSDDDSCLKWAVECNPLTMQPWDKTERRTFA